MCLVFGPLQRREAWAWWALLVAGLAIYDGFWLGNAMVSLGEPGAAPNTSQVVQTLLSALGLVLARRGLLVRAA